MKVDLAGLETTIRKLQELHRLASDPELAPFIKLRGAQKNGASKEASPVYESPFGSDVTTAAAQLGKDFTIADVYEAMKTKGHKFNGDEPKKSIGNILRALVADGHLRVAQPGRGLRASVYRF